MPKSSSTASPASTTQPGSTEHPESTPLVIGDQPSTWSPSSRHDSANRRPTGGNRRRWWWVALAGAVAITAVLALAGRQEARPEVRVVDWFTREVAAVPAAPAGPLTMRWSHALPRDHELVGIAADIDQVVVASRPRLRSGTGDDRLVVEARDPVDGRRRWRRTLDRAGRSALVIAGAGRTVLMDNMDDVAGVAGRTVWDRTSLVVVDPDDGSVRWRRVFPDGGAAVEVRPDTTMVVRTPEAVSAVDPVSGETILRFPVTDPSSGGASWRLAHRSGDAWVVPTTRGWQVTDRDGRVEFSVDDEVGRPFIANDLVVSNTDTAVVARHRPDGERAWQVDLDREIAWTELADDRPTEDGVGTRVIVHLAATATKAETTVLVEDGRTVGEVDPTRPAGSVADGSHLLVEVDGAPRTVCRRIPAGIGGGEPDCPDELALLGDGGEVLARDGSTATSHHDPSHTWQATDRGVLTVDRDAIRLRGFDDLDESWSIPVDGAARRPLRVATTATGVAVASNDATPPRVTWYQ